VPRNIKLAYKNGTRSIDGRPGQGYWQNKGQYAIALSVNPPDQTVHGTEEIVYHNNSRDTLKTLVMRFVNNLHKSTAVRLSPTSPDAFTPGLKVEQFAINGQPYAVNSDRWSTIGDVPLKAPLLPHDSIRLHIAWHYELPKLSGREGMIDSTTMYAAYSYPRVSVYDDYNGWDRVEHNGRNEFYNDFNDYTLQVSAPKNFIVWATGDLLNPSEVLQPEAAARLQQSLVSDDIIHIATVAGLSAHLVTAQNEVNTWKFAANDISDVCVGISDHYVWDGGSVVVDDRTKRRASMQAAYDDKAGDFHHSVEWGKYALDKFSHHWPGVPYPFPKMTAFQGHADMEYPMMVNDGTVGDNLRFAQLLQDHEMAHTYFPFYMGINETRYAYMDEGWATTLEYLIGIEEGGKAAADEFYKSFRVRRYINDPAAEEDQPIITMSTQVNGVGYGNNSYGKASLSYLALKDLLGDDLFKKCLHEYMGRWHGKHPIPWDYFYSFNDASKQNLNWFWNNWFFSNNYIDIAVDNVQQKGTNYVVSVKNPGGFAIPFDVIATYMDGTRATFHQTPAVWKANQQFTIITIPGSKNIRSVQVDGGIFMDANPADNVFKN
jgi:hypothetical protein